jgi:uncharacterized damage-inducible protein DinB
MEITSNTELISALSDSNQRAGDWFGQIPTEVFFKRQGEAWSPSDNLDHLIKAVKPITKALRLPKITLQAMFGKPEKPSMTYEALCQVYRDAIASGGQASGRYLPDQQSPREKAEDQKKLLLQEWSQASDELVSVAEKWQDSELDRYQIPHPLLGKLTVREMLYFTIYHNLRHASQEGD